MRPVSAWLERFRRPAAVPAVAVEELEPELTPVFATLDEIEDEARMLRANAEREAARRLDAASVEAERILERWRRRAESERERVETEEREAFASRAHAIELEGDLEAARLRERGLERIPALVASVVGGLKEEA